MVEAQTKLLLDPGPRHRCFHYSDLKSNVSYISRFPECQPIKNYAGCPAWRYSSYNSKQEHSDLLTGENASLIGVTLVNNARGETGKPSEVSFDYYYPGCSIQKSNNTSQYNLLEFDQWVFEYDVTIHTSNAAPPQDKIMQNTTKSEGACQKASRKYLATEFTYQYPDPACSFPREWNIKGANGTNSTALNNTAITTLNITNVPCPTLSSTIRTIHFDSLLFSPANSSHQNATTARPTLPEASTNYSTLDHFAPQPIAEDHEIHISLDFHALFEKYSTQLCGNSSAQAPWLNAHQIRIVSGSLGLDAVVEVGNVSAVLKKAVQGSGKRQGRGYGGGDGGGDLVGGNSTKGNTAGKPSTASGPGSGYTLLSARAKCAGTNESISGAATANTGTVTTAAGFGTWNSTATLSVAARRSSLTWRRFEA